MTPGSSDSSLPYDADADTDLAKSLRGPPQSAQGPARVYVVAHQPDRNDVVELHPGNELVVGRATDVSITIPSTEVSRRHARMWREGDQTFVEDCGSRNKTRVNGHPIEGPRELSAGDVVRVGPAELTLAVSYGGGTAWAGKSDEPDAPVLDDGIIVADPGMRDVYRFVARLAKSDASVLVLGETGVGKEIVAEQIHRQSSRASGPFVRVNCAALSESLLEAELFGHEKGAFTGADRKRTGFLEAAQGGTFFLDEVGELPASTQVKLLRVVENRTVVRLGSTTETPLDVRFVCATHRDVEAAIAEGRFRQDLYYRISAFTIRVPPLRDRRAEIPLIAERFLRSIGRTESGRPRLGQDAVAAMCRYGWPGNVRELRNAMEYAFVLAEAGEITARHLPASIGTERVAAPPPAGSGNDLPDQVAVLERAEIERALALESGNQTRAAVRLGISRRTLIYRLRKYGIGRPAT